MLTFWFEQWESDKRDKGVGLYNEKWFPHGKDGALGSKETDEIIRQKFLGLYQQAVNNELDWQVEVNPYENLAYILLLDQFTRNMFRGTEKAYEYDHLSRQAAIYNIEHKFYKFYFTGYQKLFVVYPLMHHENLQSQQLSLSFF